MIKVICHYCGKPANMVSGEVIYPHRKDLYHLKFWLCRPCGAYVGTYKDGRPFGILADAELRAAKSKTHASFDPLWKSGQMTRTEAYEWLAQQLGIPKSKCHIGMFDLEMCQKVRGICQRLLET